MSIEGKGTSAEPLSRAAYIATRVLALVGLAGAIACGVAGLLFWHRLGWPYRVILEVIPLLFFGSRSDIKRLLVPYGRYREEWAASRARAEAPGKVPDRER